MKTGPKFKIARRLGAPIFEKTQTQKYALSLARKEKNAKRSGRPKSEFGAQLIEKQKARLTYGLSERQFRSYVKKSLLASNPTNKLFSLLEARLDNILYRSGLAKTRAQARQAASHGHVMINGRRVTVPSILLSKGNKVTLRTRSAESPLFADREERIKALTSVPWLKVEAKSGEIEVVGEPVYAPTEHVFDLGAVIEFYNR